VQYNEETRQWDKLPNHPHYNDMTHNELTRGDIVGTTGGVVIECNKLNKRIEGDSYASWKALCLLPDNQFTPFVVWTVVARPEGFSAQHGEYERTLSDALETFQN
jgi:hypothetical protein